MSVNVSLRSKTKWIDIGSHTGNMHSFMVEVVNPSYDGVDAGLKALNGLTGKEAACLLVDSIDNVRRLMHSENDIKLSRFDASNGWGSSLASFLFLMQILVACNSHPKKVVWVY